jgi:hypothetical protein
MFGSCVPLGTIYLAFIVQMAVIVYTTLRKRGVANLVEHLIPQHHVTMRMLCWDLTQINKGRCHAQRLVIILLVFTEASVTSCIVLRNLNAANCRTCKGVQKNLHSALNMFSSVTFHLSSAGRVNNIYTCYFLICCQLIIN